MASPSTALLSSQIPNSCVAVPAKSPHLRRRHPITCCSPPPHRRSPAADGRRRSLSIALVLFHSSFSLPKRADAANPFDKYVKRKKLEPLEAYVPAVLLTEDQFKYLEKSLNVEMPEYELSRSLLRSGPAASLRINIRAVAQYAIDDGKGKVASDAVDQCLRALEDLDSMLLHATRKDPTASIKSMKNKVNVALGAIDRNLVQCNLKRIIVTASCKLCHHQCLIRQRQLQMHIEIQTTRKKKANLRTWIQT